MKEVKDMKEEQARLDEMKITNFKAMANHYKKDMMSLCDITEEQFETELADNSFNIEGSFERKLYAVMLLKDYKKDELLDGKLTDVRGIGGGFYSDGESYGIRFRYNGKLYQFGPINYDSGTVNIPANENRKAITNAMNETCSNKYVIDYSANIETKQK